MDLTKKIYYAFYAFSSFSVHAKHSDNSITYVELLAEATSE